MRFLNLASACAVALLSLSALSFAEELAPPLPPPPVEGQPAAQQPASGTPEVAPAEDPNEVICKKLEAETGTRLGKRKECRTRREWDEIAQEAKQNLEKSQSKN